MSCLGDPGPQRYDPNFSSKIFWPIYLSVCWIVGYFVIVDSTLTEEQGEMWSLFATVCSPVWLPIYGILWPIYYGFTYFAELLF